MHSQAHVSAKMLRPASASVAVRDRGHCNGVCGKRMGPLNVAQCSSRRVER